MRAACFSEFPSCCRLTDDIGYYISIVLRILLENSVSLFFLLLIQPLNCSPTRAINYSFVDPRIPFTKDKAAETDDSRNGAPTRLPFFLQRLAGLVFVELISQAVRNYTLAPIGIYTRTRAASRGVGGDEDLGCKDKSGERGIRVGRDEKGDGTVVRWRRGWGTGPYGWLVPRILGYTSYVA